MTTTTCLERIDELQRLSHNNENKWKRAVREEFCGRSVIADWGNKRTYRVDEVDFDKTPTNYQFAWNDQPTVLADYFFNHYGKEVKHFDQPLFLVRMSEIDCYLPPEFCLLDGVPDSIRKGAGMRDALAQTRTSPADKTFQIQQMVKQLSKQRSMTNWGV